MTHLETYLTTIKSKDHRASIKETCESVKVNVRKHNSFTHTTGLLLGQVQSGKTGQMLGIASMLADEGYRFFILLTTDNIDLQRQTYNRVFSSLRSFEVISEKEEVKFRSYNATKPLVIVLKKNSSILRKWRDLLVSSQTFIGQPLVIFDDEGDAASLNTLINRHNTSTINRRLDDIKKTATSTLYFEVTATPQAIILQSIYSEWRPSFVNYFDPGEGYLGGNYFYSDPPSYTIRHTKEDELSEIMSTDDIPCPAGLRDSLYTFLVICASKKLNHDYNCNFMIHPSSRINTHVQFKNIIDSQLNLLQRSSDDDGFDRSLYDIWLDLQKSKPDIQAYEDIKESVTQILDNQELITIPLNSKSFICRDSSNPDALDLSKGYNIVVGGNTLGRGITFPHLQVVYYCRNSKKPQADTFWQHSRIFGYDRDPQLIRIFIPESLHKLFIELNKGNEVITKQIKQGITSCQIIYPNNIQPTRRSVINLDYLDVISGGVNYYAHSPIDDNVDIIDSIISTLHLSDEPTVVAKKTITDLLKYCGSNDSNDFNSAKFISCVNALSQKRPTIKFKILVRKNRDLSFGTGTLLSPKDREIGDRITDDVLLTLYRVKGDKAKGWSGHPLWVPNIKLPEGYCYYDMNTKQKSINP